MALMLRTLSRQTVAAGRAGGLLFHKSAAPMGVNYIDPYKQMDEFWKRNRQLNRPLSPHLSIYKPQLTSMLSLCHRVTGIAMAASSLYGKQYGPRSDYSLGAVWSGLIVFTPMAWDWAMGFGLQRLYKTGWFCLTMAIIVSSTFVWLW